MRNSTLLRGIASAAAFAACIIVSTPTASRANMALAPQWAFTDEPEIPACTLRVVTAAVTLHFSRRPGRQEAIMRLTGADLPDEFSFYWQTDSGPRHRLTAYEDRDIAAYRIGGYGTPIDSHDLLLELEPVTYLSLAITARSVHQINIANFVTAFSEYRACIDRLNNRPAQETAQTIKTEEPPVEAETEEEDEPVDLADTLADRQGPVLASFRCEVTSSAMLGVPDMTGTAKFDDVTLDIFDDGSAAYNGSRMKAQIVKKANDGTLEFASYDVRDVMAAAAPDPNAPPVILNDEEARQYAGLLGAFSGMTQMVLGNRTRSLLVSLKNDTVVFFDHNNSNQITNERAPRCVRIR